MNAWAPSRDGSSTPLPITLDRRRIYLLPTRHGLVFVLVLGATLVGAVNYQNNLAFLLTFLLAALGLVSMVHGYRNLLGITVTDIGAQPVFAGRTARFGIRMAPGGRNRFAVRVTLNQAAGVPQDLAADREATLEIQFPTRHRGLLRVDRLVVSTRYPLGLVRVWAVLDPRAACLVYPRPVASILRLEPDAAAGGPALTARSGAEEFQGVAAYQPGDPIRHIYWKGLARGQGLFTKRYSDPRGSGSLLDWFAVPEADPERRIGILCHAVLERERHKLAYGLRLPQRLIQPALGSSHRHRCLEALACMPAPVEEVPP